jgi:hypothetical protein
MSALPRTFQEWQKECAKIAKRLVGITDLLDEDDPYDLAQSMDDAYPDQDPEEFVREVFGDDLARQEHDAQLYEESLEYEDEDE